MAARFVYPPTASAASFSIWRRKLVREPGVVRRRSSISVRADLAGPSLAYQSVSLRARGNRMCAQARRSGLLEEPLSFGSEVSVASHLSPRRHSESQIRVVDVSTQHRRPSATLRRMTSAYPQRGAPARERGVHISEDLQKALAATPRKHVCVITTEFGKQFTVDGFSGFMRDAIKRAGSDVRDHAGGRHVHVSQRRHQRRMEGGAHWQFNRCRAGSHAGGA